MRFFRSAYSFFIGSALLLLLAAGWAFFALRGINEPLILHFSPYTGINQIGSRAALFGVAATGFIVVAINSILAHALRQREPLWARCIEIATLFIAVLQFIAFMAIISANI